ncbi:15897_t:CDS:1, partial [Funneliformis geosporum]
TDINSAEMTDENQNDTLIVPSRGSNESTPNTTLPIITNQSLTEAMTSVTTSNPFSSNSRPRYDEDEDDREFGHLDEESMQGTSLFNNANITERGEVSDRVIRRVSFNLNTRERSNTFTRPNYPNAIASGSGTQSISMGT